MLKAFTLAAVLALATGPAWAQSSGAAASGAGSTTSSAAASSPAAGSSASSAGASATAAPSPALVKIRQVCAADFAKQCPGINAASEQGRACVRDHFSDLSEPCQGAIMEYMASQNAG